MEIKWTKCTDAMPPDDETRVICKFLPPIAAEIRKCMGRNIWSFIFIRNINPRKIEWMYFDQRIWDIIENYDGSGLNGD